MTKRPRSNISFWLPPEREADLREAAAKEGVSVSEVIRRGAAREARRILGGRKCRHCGERG